LDTVSLESGRDGSSLSKGQDPAEVLERFEAELELVSLVARQVSRSVRGLAERDDLMSAGREGLLDAARRYDAARGVPFRAFANFRVRGAMLDAVRRMATIPRRTYERLAAEEAALLVSEGSAEHAFADAGAPNVVEAEHALDEHLAAMATAAAVSLVAEAGRAVAPSEDADANPEEALARAELMALVEQALSEISPREAEIVRLHYLEGHSIESIARTLNIDKSWTSRLHTRAMARITKRLRSTV